VRLRRHVHTVWVDFPHALVHAVAVNRDFQDAPRNVAGRVRGACSLVLLVNSRGLQRHKFAQVTVVRVILLVHALLLGLPACSVCTHANAQQQIHQPEIELRVLRLPKVSSKISSSHLATSL